MNSKTVEAIRVVVAGMRGEKRAEEAVPPEMRAYVAGFCKAAEAAGVDPGALMKSAGLFRTLGKVGLLGLAGYGGLRGYQDYKALTAPPPAPPPPPPSTWDKVKGFAAEHPIGTAAAAIGIPLLGYLGYKAFSSKGDDRRGYPYPYG